ncbi:MAG: hypothetical protein JRF15_04675 [Deltaproteobacteria bacterium]|jgi:hypothetical protein|nr:hypothetical protein [Deltaproteobacteria bacterium]
MAERETLSEATESRINEAVKFVDDEFQRIQRELNARRKSLEKDFTARRKKVEKRTRKEMKRIQSEFKKNPIVKRADAARKDVTKQVESRVDSLLGLMQIAPRSEVQRLNKKLTTMNRRLKAAEDGRITAELDAQRLSEKMATLNRRLKAIEESRKTNGGSAVI